ncbi:MAG: hypothetical protein SFV19_03730 [Rhodospirillaceae bacterium]|nr:hypothetical protein [Rhodospirillaceae bacterium]
MARIVLNLLAMIISTVSAAQASTLTVRASECQRLVQHASTNDATYTPGVDVRGNAVAPADLDGGSIIALPESIDIQVGVDLADRLGIVDRTKGTPRDQATRKVMPFEGKVPLGTLTIKGQDAFWNGERMLPQDQVLLTEACRLSLTSGQAGLPTRKPQ